MLKDQINLYSSLKNLRMKCYGCGQSGHTANDCKLLHFSPDCEKIIKAYEFSFTQDRSSTFKRKKINRSHFHLYQTILLKKNMPNTMDEESSDEGEADADEPHVKNEKKISLFSKESSSKYLSQLSVEGKFSPKNNIANVPRSSCHTAVIQPPSLQITSPALERHSLNYAQNSNSTNANLPSSFGSVVSQSVMAEKLRQKSVDNKIFLDAIAPKEKLPIAQPEENILGLKRVSFKLAQPLMESKLKISTITAPISSSFLSNVSSNNNNRSNTSSSNESQKKKIGESQVIDLNLKIGVENFETIHNFQKYFPDNNFNYIKQKYNEKNPGMKIPKRRRRELLRLSQYTFSAFLMQEKLQERKKNIPFLRNSEEVDKSCDIKTVKSRSQTRPNLLSLVSTIVKNIKKEKAIQKKWYFPVWRLVSKKKNGFYR